MLNERRNLTLDIYDYSGNKQCTIYDSQSDIQGQATDVVLVTERNGWKQLSFNIPCKCQADDGSWEDNYRLSYLKADYRIRFVDDNGVDWFLLQEPKVVHNNYSKNVSVSADHIAALLKTKNLGLEFSDEEGNNVGTAADLLDTILDGTGWERGVVDEFTEKRTGAVKVRSMKASTRSGAFKLISNMCDLFEAKPVYHGDTRKVDIVKMNPFTEPKEGELPNVDYQKTIELHYGKNLKNVARTLNTDNIVTKLYAYGAYGDKVSGYCGIDEFHHPEYTLTTSDAVTAGTECYFQIYDQASNLTYHRWFTPIENLAAGDTVVWSMLDPASMSYVWNEATEKAYAVHKERQSDISETLVTFTPGQPEDVVNRVQYLMDFDYYSQIGLLSDEMLQTIAKYQHKIPQLIEDSTDAATDLATHQGVLSDTVGVNNFCKLSVGSSENRDGYLKLNLNIKSEDNPSGYPNGMIYRSDYDTPVRKWFKWRRVEKLKENGDPVTTGGSIIYIVHPNENPNLYTYEKAYLKEINESSSIDDMFGWSNATGESLPTNITLWMEYDSTYAQSLQDADIFLFQANVVDGYLGAVEVGCETIDESLATITTVETTKHPVYIQQTAPPSGSNAEFIEYAWWWKQDPDPSNPSTMYFQCLSDGDTLWQPVTFLDRNPEASDCEPSSNGRYAFNWRANRLWRQISNTKWSEVDADSIDERIDDSSAKTTNMISTFGTVWMNCLQRDILRRGKYQYYAVTVDQNLIDRYGMYNGSSYVLPAGNYAIENEAGTYFAFTTKNDLSIGDKMEYDTTNRWVTCTSDDKTTPDIIERIQTQLATKEYTFDSVTHNADNILDGILWEAGKLTKNQAEDNYDVTNKSYISGEGGETDNVGQETFHRSGFCNVYPNIRYIVTSPILSETYVFFYTQHNTPLGHIRLNNQSDIFMTGPSVRHVRFVTSGTYSTMSASAINNETSFVAAEQTYCIIGSLFRSYSNMGTVETYGELKGLVPLIKKFVDEADETYLTSKEGLHDAQGEIKRENDLFIGALGDMYREGYWQKKDYVDGDEEKLYYDALDNLEKIAMPETKYDIQFVDLYGQNRDMEYSANDMIAGLEWPDIQADFGVHLVDPELDISQWAFIDKLSKCYDQPWKTTMTINTNLTTIGQHSFADVLANIANVTSHISGKTDVYDRSQYIMDDGQFSVEALEGVINTNKLSITGAASTWHTDDKGNMVFTSQDGTCAMTITGNGFAIADSKDEYGDWQWRTKHIGSLRSNADKTKLIELLETPKACSLQCRA